MRHMPIRIAWRKKFIFNNIAMKLLTKHKVYAVGGILLMGFGLSVLGEAIRHKTIEKGFKHWFGGGTLGLTIFFSGLSVFGQAVVFKSIIEGKSDDKLL